MSKRIFCICAVLWSAIAPAVAHAEGVMWVDTGWTELRAGQAFAITAPPGTVYRELRGTDSFVGEFVHPDFKIGFDYGLWSNSLSKLKSGFLRESAKLGGQDAIIVSGPGAGQFGCNGNLVAAYVRDVGAQMLAPVSLEIHGCAKDARETPILKRMFKSLRFGKLKLK